MSEQASEEPLLFEVVDEHIAIIRFNRPRVRNAVDGPTASAMAAAVQRTEQDPAICAVVLTSSTPGMFCAGADLKTVAAGCGDDLYPGSGGFAGFIDAVRTKPWIAAVDGFAFGGGFEMCLACDMIIATPESCFALPEVKRGLIANAGGVHRIARVLPRNIALQLVATGEPIGAEPAAAFGMVNMVVSSGDLEAEALKLANVIAANAPVSVRESLYVARQSSDRSDVEMRRLSDERMLVVMATEDSKEGPRAFAEKRQPVWQGC